MKARLKPDCRECAKDYRPDAVKTQHCWDFDAGGPDLEPGCHWTGPARYLHATCCHTTFTSPSAEANYHYHAEGGKGTGRRRLATRCLTDAERRALGAARNEAGAWHRPFDPEDVERRRGAR